MNTEPTSPADAPTARQRIVLVVWLAAAVALFGLASPAPSAPGPSPEEEAARSRMVAWAVRDARRWRAERGDHVIPWDEARGHLAIVIDDVGRELVWQEQLLALRYRLTFSILPGSVYAPGSQLRLRQDHRRPREIMLHLPMEPKDASMMRAGAEAREEFLLTEDSGQLLRDKLERALARVPAATGVNNHMGSALTEDAAAMDAIMPTLARRGLFFLDSRTSPETQAQAAAERAGVPTGRRHVFLDHDPSPEAIRAAFREAAARALDEPTIVIAHPSQALVKILGEELPRLEGRQIGIYPLSEVLGRLRARSARG